MRKIAVVVNSRANYGRVKSAMEAIEAHPELELVALAGASAVLPKYSHQLSMEAERVLSIVEGESPLAMAMSAGLGTIQLATAFDRLKPDAVIVIADRFEQLSVAIAAAYQNIPVAHIQGGEVTGSIDESVRHAITKLSHLHFVSTARAKEYVIRMGEPENTVWNTGCPSIDLLKDIPRFTRFPDGGVGYDLDPERPFLLVLQHPVTTEYGEGRSQIEQTIGAIRAFGMQAVWLWPNIDAGSDEISKALREFHEKSNHPVRFYRNLPPHEYYSLMQACYCQVGNSSSAIREGSYLGVPAINIGSRQQSRERGPNVVDVGYDANQIVKALRDPPWRNSSDLYGDGKAGKRIANILARCELSAQKLLSYTEEECAKSAVAASANVFAIPARCATAGGEIS